MTEKLNLREDIKKVLMLIGKNKVRFLLFSLGTGITNTLVGIFISFATKNMVDYFTMESGNHIRLAVMSIIFAIISGGMMFPVFYYFINMMKAKIINQVRLDLFSHLQKMPARYFELHHSGDTLARVNKDLNALELALDTIDNFLVRLISMCLIIPYIIALDYRLGVISFILGLIAMVFNIKFRIPMREKSKEIHKYNASMTEQMTDNVTGFNVIKTYNLSERYFRKYREKVDEVIAAELKLSWTNGFLYSTNSLIGWFGRGGLAVIGCFFVINGSMTAGTLMGGIFTASSLSYSLIDMGEMLATVQKSFAGSDRVYELLEEPVEPARYETSGTGCDSGIAITDGVFSYLEGEEVIDGLTIKVGVGKMAALVGYSGGGKSTIAKLLMGLYELESGEMCINRKAVSSYTLEELRDTVAYVPQNAYVFNGTIRENILYGKGDATEEEIVEASKKANAHEFIMEQVNQYETVVGERGIKLSGGQRQRVAIARAILKDSPVLLLDEATSSLDSQSEQLIQNALEILMKNRTSLVVAHRLSTILHADVIYFIKDGKVAEEGTHEELLSKQGLYYELYHREFRK